MTQPFLYFFVLSLTGCLFFDSTTTITADKRVLLKCGNGQIDVGEECDPKMELNTGCADLSFVGGRLSCTADCTYDTSSCEAPPGCGNGQIDPGEQCDGQFLPSQSCTFFEFEGGDLKCTAACIFDFTECNGTSDVTCGDGVVDPNEECDGTSFKNGSECKNYESPISRSVYESGTLSCDTSCKIQFDQCSACGDGILSESEACDDGPETNADLLHTDDVFRVGNQTCMDVNSEFYQGQLRCLACQINTDNCNYCGNGAVEAYAGEECDSNLPEVSCQHHASKPFGMTTCDASSCKYVDGVGCSIGFAQLSVGDGLNCGVTTEGVMQCWKGESAHYSDKNRVYSEIKVSSKRDFYCALASGKVFCWGGINEQASDKDWNNLSQVQHISLSDAHVCALLVDDTVQCFDFDGKSITMDPPLKDVKKISSGSNFICGLGRATNSISCVGFSSEAMPPSLRGGFVDLSAGGTVLCGLNDAHKLECLNRQSISDVFEMDVGEIGTCWQTSTGLICDTTLAPPSNLLISFDVGVKGACGILADSGDAICWNDNTSYVVAPIGR